jgi:glycosyltransferase involved in cell wall biosynthesis
MTRDEEVNIGKCLVSLSQFAEVFVVDSHSTDRTCDIAERAGAKVVTFTWNRGYPKKKQWCLDNLPFCHDWVLYVDADEEVTTTVAEEIAATLDEDPDSTGHAGYFIGYDYAFMGRILRHGHRPYKLILLNRHKSRFLEYDDLDATNMWEVEGHYQPVIDGKSGVLRSRMIHWDHVSLFHYFERHNKYSDWEAVWRYKKLAEVGGGTDMYTRRVLKRLFDALPFKGAVAFLDGFVLRRGFLDGYAGFQYAIARGFYYWQVGAKLRELEIAQRQPNPLVSVAESTAGTEKSPSAYRPRNR